MSLIKVVVKTLDVDGVYSRSAAALPQVNSTELMAVGPASVAISQSSEREKSVQVLRAGLT